MSINEDAISDLPNETSTEDITSTGNIVSIIKDESDSQNKALALIVGADATMDQITNDLSDIKELQYINDEINKQNTITRSEAEMIDGKFGKQLVEEGLSLEEFTITPTRTNLDRTKSIMSKVIVSKEEAVLDTFKLFSEKALNDIAKLPLYEVHDNYLDKIAENIVALRYHYGGLSLNIKGNLDYLMCYDKQFENIADKDISLLCLNKIENELANKERTQKAVNAIKEILTIPSVRIFMAASIGKKDIEDIYYPERGMDQMENVVTVASLMKFIISSSSEDLVYHLKSMTQELTKLCMQLDEQVKSYAVDIDTLGNFIDNDTKEQVVKMLNKSQTMFVLTVNLLALTELCDTVFDFYKKI